MCSLRQKQRRLECAPPALSWRKAEEPRVLYEQQEKLSSQENQRFHHAIGGIPEICTEGILKNRSVSHLEVPPPLEVSFHTNSVYSHITPIETKSTFSQTPLIAQEETVYFMQIRWEMAVRQGWTSVNINEEKKAFSKMLTFAQIKTKMCLSADTAKTTYIR